MVASHGSGFSRCRAQASGAWASVVTACGLWSVGLIVGAHGLSYSMARGIFPEQELDPYPLHWQMDS